MTAIFPVRASMAVTRTVRAARDWARWPHCGGVGVGVCASVCWLVWGVHTCIHQSGGGSMYVHVNGMRGKEHTTHDMYMEMACVARQIKTRDARTHPKVLADVGVAPALGGERLRHLWKE